MPRLIIILQSVNSDGKSDRIGIIVKDIYFSCRAWQGFLHLFYNKMMKPGTKQSHTILRNLVNLTNNYKVVFLVNVNSGKKVEKHFLEPNSSEMARTAAIHMAFEDFKTYTRASLTVKKSTD